MTPNYGRRILVRGTAGAVGAMAIVVADVLYNVFDGSHLGNNLYWTTYLGVFLFPLWWGGLWVVYQGLRPAGRIWSLYPCLLLAAILCTINVSQHAWFPFWAAIHDMQQSVSGPEAAVLNNLEAAVLPYTAFIQPVSEIAETIVALWFTIPVLLGKSMFPRWTVILIPIYPLLAAYVVDLKFPGFLEGAGPYIGSGFMCLIFVLTTFYLYRGASVRGESP
jgi:hypothetical protein